MCFLKPLSVAPISVTPSVDRNRVHTKLSSSCEGVNEVASLSQWKKGRSNHWAQHTWGVHLSYCLWWAGWKNSQAEEEKHQTGAEWAFYERFFDKDKSAAWTKVISDELIVTALLRFTFSTSRAKTCVSWAAPLTKLYMCLLLKVSQADLLLWLEWCTLL